MRRGRLNIHPGVGGSLSAIAQDLHDIWGEAIEGHLDIPLKDLMVRFFISFAMKNNKF